MFEYLDDLEFLMALDKLNVRTHYAKLVLLSFDEKPIKEIQGNVTSGSLSVNSSSAIRRTISLTMLASTDNADLENIDNEISINKKVRAEVGFRNPFFTIGEDVEGIKARLAAMQKEISTLANKKKRTTAEDRELTRLNEQVVMVRYKSYGPTIWFPCGLFVLSSASTSRDTQGWNISITGKDKMVMLDGTVGGTLPASTSFHERWLEIDATGDVQERQKPTIFQIIYEAVNHWGGEPIENIVITDLDEEVKMLVRYMGDKPIYFNDEYEALSFEYTSDFRNMYSYGDDVGYEMTDFTYPEELILKAGDTVVTLLNKIVDTLGNYEFFYDVWGHFIFQEKKNYLNWGSPLNELTENDYTRTYSNTKYLYNLTDLDTTTAIIKTPRYDNVKNDFYVWGQRKTTEDVEIDIRYHLAIDAKPTIDWAGQYFYEVADSDGYIIRYEVSAATRGDSYTTSEGYIATLKGTPCTEWREELYRKALEAQVGTSVNDDYYDSELIAEWRKLYDPMKSIWDAYDHWNPDVFNDPGKLNYWLDFIDTGSALGQYSIGRIGRRTKVVNSNDLKTVYNKEVPDIVFIEGPDQTLMTEYRNIGQKFFVLTSEYYDLFSISTTGASCFDKIRELMYQNLNYNTTISLTCLPKYYMETNNVIHIEDRESKINGNYLVTQFTLPLAYDGTMSITATEVLTRV